MFAKHQTLSSWCWIFSSWSRSHKIRLLLISKFFVYCCCLLLISLKPTFSQILIYSQSLAKILWRPDEYKITFKAIEKYRYGLWKTIWKLLLHLNSRFNVHFLYPKMKISSLMLVLSKKLFWTALAACFLFWEILKGTLNLSISMNKLMHGQYCTYLHTIITAYPFLNIWY